MFWIIRGTDPRTQSDFAFVVESTSQAMAEAWALKRGIEPAFVGQAERGDVREARRNRKLWRYSPEPRYQCFGQALVKKQLACLLIVGIATMGLVVTRTVRNPKRVITSLIASARGSARPTPARTPSSPQRARPQTAEFHPWWETREA